VRGANTGISAVIDPYGRGVAVTRLGEARMIESPIPAPITAPFYAQWRISMFLLSLAVCVLAIVTKILYRASAI
jgi:apolipoprotein N-acyltransferase